MSSLGLARRLFEIAAEREQVAYRIRPKDDVGTVRKLVRGLARANNVRILTARMGDVLVVVRADAAIWNDPVPVMKVKLSPTL